MFTKTHRIVALPRLRRPERDLNAVITKC
jgi:hypothetical protein